MNYSIIKYVLGIVLGFLSVFLMLPVLVAVIYKESAGYCFLACSLGSLLLGIMIAGEKPKNRKVHAREGMVMVALSWVIMSIMGAIPFVATGAIPNFVDAVFETVSGFTTTGASIMPAIEHLPHSILFWRCFTNWIGGMGVLVFIMAVLPYLGASNLYLMRAESTGPSVGKLVPKIQTTAVLLYGIYVGLTVLQIILLLLGKMPLFDAVCISIASAGTGGFAVLNDSAASYSSYCQIVITIFLFLFGVNFKFYFLLLNKKMKDAFAMEEVRWYFIIYIAVVGMITADICTDVGELAVSIKDAAFQVSSIMTTAGFASVDFVKWPEFSQALLVLVMLIGACAGSTGGGMKVSRILIYVKSIRNELQYQLHPRCINKVKMDGKVVDDAVLRSARIFLAMHFVVAAVSILILCLDKYDLLTNFTAVMATLNNIGPGLGAVGPMGNFSGFSILSKFVMIFDMLAGRLELIPMLLLLNPATWKKH